MYFDFVLLIPSKSRFVIPFPLRSIDREQFVFSIYIYIEYNQFIYAYCLNFKLLLHKSKAYCDIDENKGAMLCEFVKNLGLENQRKIKSDNINTILNAR